jgi:hypothetical protein
MLSFKNFLQEEKQMTPMTPKEWLKYDWRIEVFLKKYKNKEPFELKNGQKVIFVYDNETYNAMKSRDSKRIGSITLSDSRGITYRVSDIGKNKEFGGKGSGAGTAKEDRELESLIRQIDDAKSEIASSTIPIFVNGVVYDVFTAQTTPGTPKSDFHLVDINGKEVVWISHKDGKTAKDFQQWGGISQRSEPKIFSHLEVQKFISDLKQTYPNGIPRATTLYRKIKDNKLKMLSIYGNEYGQRLSRQNVSVMLQGPVRLKKSGRNYVLDSNHVHYNGDPMTGAYEPVLTAIYKGDRSDAGVKGTRIVIMPIGGRRMTGDF